MGNKSSRDNNDTIDWNNINTEDMSSTIAIGGASINKDAKELVSRLDISSLRDNNLDENNKSNDIFKKLYKTNNTKSDYSKTSPFISSEMYNYLLENSSSSNIENGIQKGGRLETSSTDQNNSDNLESRMNRVMDNLTDSSIEINGGDDDSEEKKENKENKEEEKEEEEDEEEDEEDEGEETNSLETTEAINEAGDINDTVTNEELKTAESQVDDEDDDDDDDDDNDDDDNDDDDDEEDDSKELEDDSSDDNQIGGKIGYTSSSAHTSKSSEYDTTISIGNNKILSESINTSDINMVSVDN